jgi:polyhydroxybutyrate depolymerase
VRVIQFGGLERSFQVHVPKSYDPRISMPVVFVFHAFGSDVLQMMLYARFREKADREGFIVVHPQGRLNSWNGGTCCGVAASQDVDDVGFVRATLNSLKSDLCIDPKRVFATGMSNGGFFAHRLACELSDEIAAVASVAGVLGVSSCQPRRPVPVLQIHGTADAVVPFSGNAILGFRSVPATVATWRRLNACQNRSRITLRKPDSACEAWSECQSGSEVVLCTVRLGGHTWPGAFPLPGAYTSPFLDATDVAWDFMRTHPIP